MFSKSFLVLTVTFSPFSVSGQPIQPCSNPPRDFTVNQFTIFTPSSGNTEPARLSFNVGSTSCTSKIVLNPKIAQACTDASYDYLWDGKSLTLREIITPCADA